MNINKKTLKKLNIEQNALIRYMTGLSRNSHISNSLRILKIFNIFELYIYMKLIFVKNLHSNSICKYIFSYLLTQNQKPRSLSFMKEFKIICINLELDNVYVIDNILKLIQNYKDEKLSFEDSIDNEMIIECFRKNTDPKMRDILNLITYAGPLVLNTS